jgi:hypothetical protein
VIGLPTLVTGGYGMVGAQRYEVARATDGGSVRSARRRGLMPRIELRETRKETFPIARSVLGNLAYSLLCRCAVELDQLTCHLAGAVITFTALNPCRECIDARAHFTFIL